MATSEPIRLSGLTSGIDSDALIAKLIEANSARVKKLQTQRSNIETTKSAFAALGDKMKTLLTAAEKLAKTETFDTKSVTVSDSDALSVTASTSGIAGTYRITDFQRSTASRVTGASDIAAAGTVNLNSTLSSSGLTTTVVGDGVSSGGTFKINGKTIAYQTNESMGAILSRVNNSDAGVTAIYDQFLDRVTITNKQGGAEPITLEDVGSSNFLAAVGVTGGSATNTTGTQAKLKIDGLNNGDFIYSNDDIFTDTETGLSGLSFTLKKDGTSADVTIGTDTTGVRTAFDTFVTAYNDVVKFIKDRSSIVGTGANKQTGLFYGDQSVQQLSRELRTMLSSGVDGQTPGLSSLGSLGVGTTSQAADLSVYDGSKLESALRNNLNGVKSLLTDSTSGVMTRFKTFVKAQATGANGLVGTKSNSLSDRIELMDITIDRENRKISNEEKSLRAQFAAMEKATSSLQGGVSQLLSSLGTS